MLINSYTSLHQSSHTGHHMFSHHLVFLNSMEFASKISFIPCLLSIHLFIFSSSSLLLCSSAATATSMIQRNETDRRALLEFKAKITRDPLHILSSWNDSNHFCQWQGVTCSRRHQRVTKLNLYFLRLEGSLSPYIGNLSFLRVLNLQNNGFRNEIPQEITHLFRLQVLGFGNNSFGGEIPANISRCTNLKALSLGNNELVGKVPVELGSLSKLWWIFIYTNNLSGEIPSSFGNLSSLERLIAEGNNFVGSIPDTLSQLKRLTHLSLGANKLSGMIPPSIYNISSLVNFYVPENQFQGGLPSNLGFTLPNLEVINVASNQFSGPIPTSISNASNLMRLTIPANKFAGKVPTLENLQKLQWLSITDNSLGSGKADDLSFLSSLINATSLQKLLINYNQFGGVLPEVISNFSTQLTVMDVTRNQIYGSIPTGIGNLHKLESLDLARNQISGSIPVVIGKLQNLKRLYLRVNKFSGNIPSSIGNLTLLTEFNVERNNLQGSIPPSLGNSRSLILLDLSRNNLSGTIPLQVFGLSSLSIYLDLSRNHLTGSLPIEVGNLQNLAAFSVSENKLSGKIPSSLGRCTSLVELFMAANFFQGHIPPSLSSLRGIQFVDLSHNNLSGQIPKYLENFYFLQNLNISFNNFEGEVPIEGVFKNASAISIDGNDKLCGGIPELNLSTCSFDGSKRRWSLSLKLLIPLVCGILLLALMFSIVVLYWLRKKRKKPSSESSLLASILQVSYANLLKATGGFSSENLIGMGSFGSVYKGILDHDGTIIAVKVLNLLNQAASKSFLAECEALRNIRHRNLVKILTACSSVDFQGNDFKALVYDFMVNGSLEEWLHPIPRIDEGHEVFEAPMHLTFLQRLNIAIDVASALDYLHHYCRPPIVHCDLKPSNVLLDNEMTGHVGDFGLARILSEATHNISINETSSVGIKGSIGYMAPEYGMGSKVSTHGDMYSYGILLLEIFTGKGPTDDIFKDGLSLHNFVKMALPEQVAGIADPVLLQEIEGGEMGTNNTRNQCSMRNYEIQQCLISILGIGVACSAELPRERKNISDVVAELRSIRNKLLGTEIHGERPNISTRQSVHEVDN